MTVKQNEVHVQGQHLCHAHLRAKVRPRKLLLSPCFPSSCPPVPPNMLGKGNWGEEAGSGPTPKNSGMAVLGHASWLAWRLKFQGGGVLTWLSATASWPLLSHCLSKTLQRLPISCRVVSTPWPDLQGPLCLSSPPLPYPQSILWRQPTGTLMPHTSRSTTSPPCLHSDQLIPLPSALPHPLLSLALPRVTYPHSGKEPLLRFPKASPLAEHYLVSTTVCQTHQTAQLEWSSRDCTCFPYLSPLLDGKVVPCN